MKYITNRQFQCFMQKQLKCSKPGHFSIFYTTFYWICHIQRQKHRVHRNNFLVQQNLHKLELSIK